MQRDTPWRLLLAAQLFVVGGVAALQGLLAPELMRLYAEGGVELGALTALSLGTPAPLLVAAGCMVATLASLAAKRGTRLRVMSVSLIVSGAVFVTAFVAAVWPLSH